MDTSLSNTPNQHIRGTWSAGCVHTCASIGTVLVVHMDLVAIQETFHHVDLPTIARVDQCRTILYEIMDACGRG